MRRSLGTRSERGVGMRTASAFTRWKRVCRGLKPQPTRVVLSAQRVLRVTAGEAADAGKCEVRAASALVAACERAARGPLRRPFPAPARGRGRGEGGAALGAAPRRVVGNGVAFERCGGAGVPGLRPRSSGRRLAAATTRRRRKSWCLRLERAHDHPTRFHRASALQELRGIASVSAGRPLFIPFLRIAVETPETARSSFHRRFPTMARPGLEPGTPRFSVVTSRAHERAKWLEINRFRRGEDVAPKSAVCGRVPAVQEMSGFHLLCPRRRWRAALCAPRMTRRRRRGPARRRS